MSKIKTINNKLDVLFKQIKGLNSDEYKIVMMNLQILQIKYFMMKNKKANLDLLECREPNILSFKDYFTVS